MEVGRTETFDCLFESHRSAVFSYFLGQTGQREDSLDLTLEVFSRAWLRIEDVARIPEDRRRFWIFAIAKNVWVDFRRRAKVREGTSNWVKSSVAETATADVHQSVERSIQMESVDNAIMHLPEGLRTVLVMSVVGEMTSSEIAKLLGRPAGTIRSLLHDARQQLRNIMVSEGQL